MCFPGSSTWNEFGIPSTDSTHAMIAAVDVVSPTSELNPGPAYLRPSIVS